MQHCGKIQLWKRNFCIFGCVVMTAFKVPLTFFKIKIFTFICWWILSPKLCLITQTPISFPFSVTNYWIDSDKVNHWAQDPVLIYWQIWAFCSAQFWPKPVEFHLQLWHGKTANIKLGIIIAFIHSLCEICCAYIVLLCQAAGLTLDFFFFQLRIRNIRSIFMLLSKTLVTCAKKIT